MLPRVTTLLILASAAVASCGDSGAAEVAGPAGIAAGAAQPAAPLASATLAGVAAGADADRRLGFVAVAATKRLASAVDPARVARWTLGDAGSDRLDASTTAAAQLGDATLVVGTERAVIGGDAAQRDALREPSPLHNAIEDETPSAVQSCLGDPAAEVILGPATMGTKAAIGAAILDSADTPAGPKLRICAAPHHYRDLARIEARLRAAFPAREARAERWPVIGEEEIGERDVVSGVVALADVDDALLGALLSGGDALRALGRPGPPGGAGTDAGPQ